MAAFPDVRQLLQCDPPCLQEGQHGQQSQHLEADSCPPSLSPLCHESADSLRCITCQGSAGEARLFVPFCYKHWQQRHLLPGPMYASIEVCQLSVLRECFRQSSFLIPAGEGTLTNALQGITQQGQQAEQPTVPSPLQCAIVQQFSACPSVLQGMAGDGGRCSSQLLLPSVPAGPHRPPVDAPAPA